MERERCDLKERERQRERQRQRQRQRDRERHRETQRDTEREESLNYRGRSPVHAGEGCGL